MRTDNSESEVRAARRKPLAARPKQGTGPARPRNGGPAFAHRSGIAKLASRSRSNLANSLAIIRARLAGRPARYPPISWIVPIGIVLLLTALAFGFVDAPAADYRDRWPDWLKMVAQTTTDIGLSGWYITPAVFVLLAVNLVDWEQASAKARLLLYNWTSLAGYVLISVGLSGLLVTTAKRIIGRARPHLNEGILSFEPFSLDAAYASFPSGHSTTMGAVTAILFLFLPRAGLLILPVGAWIASTRILVGAHYPSDVIAGFSFGFLFAIFTANVFARLGYLFRQRPSGLPERKRSFRLIQTS